ncbi:MAG: diguanylate cyclase [Roseburia sp.]|nr:diguanylate cyclase [Roseburia sp.]
MKKIALVMDGWKRFFTYAWPAGILQRIRETDEDVNLYIFNSSGDWSWDTDYNIGEYNIYRLPDFKDFDGIIVDVNNIRYPELVEELADMVRRSGKPAVSIANELSGFYYVGIDNYKSMTAIIGHLYEVHGCRRFWFIMGPKENYENSVRVSALRDFMERHKLAYSEDDFYFESYEYLCGYKGFMRMLGKLDEGARLPDAVICANDNIAVGVLEAAAEKGYHVPEDFCVTGFDDFDKASYYSPRITTVGHIREEVGYRSADLLLRIWRGEPVERFNFTATTPIYWDSCGCKSSQEVDQAAHIKGQMMYEIETTEFEEQVLALDYELLSCKSVKEISACIPSCIPAFKCDAIYLVLDEHMNDFHRRNDVYNQSIIGDEKFPVKGYPDSMFVEFAYDSRFGAKYENQVIDGLFPLFDYAESGVDFLFMPLHFRNHTVGYFVIRNAIYLMEKQYLFKVLNTLTSAMENLHEKERLAYMNRMLSEMSIRDSMTGLYNRLAFSKLAVGFFEESRRRGERIPVMFIDMDRLKYINDHFGHEYGDLAIQTLARAIMENCDEDAIAIRNGGDEFVIIRKPMPEEDCREMLRRVRVQIEREAQERKLPFSLSFSAGIVYTEVQGDKSLDDYINMADEVMYEEKARKRANRTE